MNLYAQHGYGKSDKLDRGFDDGSLDGVIFGPNNERPETLALCMDQLSNHGSEPALMIDPQIYVSMIPNAREGYLPAYEDYYESNLTLRDLTPRRIQRLVSNALNFQSRFSVARLIAPTILLDNLNDRTAQISHFLSEAAIEYHSGLENPPPLLLTYVFNEVALSSHDQIAEFLDTVSLYRAAGFYLIIVREVGQYQQWFPSNRMAEWLVMIYSLAVRNRFEVVCGYTDLVGLLAGAVGANAIATGWFNLLRQFEIRRFLPATGGRAPRERYTSGPLLNSIFFQELINCHDAGRLRRVLSGTRYDQDFQRGGVPDPDRWPPDVSCLHHWATIRQLCGMLGSRNVRERVTALEQAIGRAEMIYADLRERGVTFEPTTGPTHLRQWSQAIALFRAAVRL